MNDVQNILGAIDRVQPFPNVVVKALALLEDPEVPASKLIEVIQFDPVITLRILKICNSAMYGLQREVESLGHALVLLGNRKMMRLLITSGSLDVLDGSYVGYGLEEGELWRHAVACALMSQVLQKAVGQGEDYALFTGALLHDVGKIILSEYADQEHQRILRQVWSFNQSSLEAEREVLGIDHAQVGSLLAERWQFPPAIISIIGRHHDPVDPRTDPMALCLAHLANLLCLQLGIGVGDRGLVARSSPEIIKGLGWSPSTLDRCVASFWMEYEQVGELLNLSGSDKGSRG